MLILFDHGTPSGWRVVRLYLDRIALAVNEATPGSYAVVDIPFR